MMEETAEGFDEVNAVNLRGVSTCMKPELLPMKKQGNVGAKFLYTEDEAA